MHTEAVAQFLSKNSILLKNFVQSALHAAHCLALPSANIVKKTLRHPQPVCSRRQGFTGNGDD